MENKKIEMLFYKMVRRIINTIHRDLLLQTMYKLKDWIDQDKINWTWFSLNPAALTLLENNQKKINWSQLSANPSARAIALLEKNQNEIDWTQLSANPSAISILEKNQYKIDWIRLSENPAIFEYDYKE